VEARSSLYELERRVRGELVRSRRSGLARCVRGDLAAREFPCSATATRSFPNRRLILELLNDRYGRLHPCRPRARVPLFDRVFDGLVQQPMQKVIADALRHH